MRLSKLIRKCAIVIGVALISGGAAAQSAAELDALKAMLGGSSAGRGTLPLQTPRYLGGSQTPSQPVEPQDVQKPLPPEPPGEFQRQVSQTTGANLPIFGQDLFSGVPTTFAPIDRVPVTAEYLIGPGDEIMLRVWGKVEMDLKLPVDRNGSIYVPEVGSISVAGVRYEKLNEHLTRAIGRVLRNFELNASLGQLRSIQVFVVGQARRPGSYTVSSLSTLVNTLFVSGGPSSHGSMREIQVKRGNRVVTNFDLYDLIINGDKSKDVQLLPGDVIYIPPVGQQVAITGSVKVPAVYEAKSQSTLGDLIDWAGGLNTGAAGQKITVDRITNRSERNIDEFEISKAKTVALRDGDIVKVYRLSPRVDNVVSLRGSVAQPIRLPWREGMRVTDVIPDANALIVPQYWVDQTSLVRRASGQFASDPTARLGNDESATTGQKKLIEEIHRSSAEVNWDYALIERLKPDLSSELLPFNLGKAVLQKDPIHDLVLRAGDVITVFSIGDIAVPESRQTKFVRLEGEFLAAGVYRLEANETLRQLITRVGGTTPGAYIYGTQLSRESTRIQQQEKLDELVARLERDVERNASSKAANALSAEDAAALKADVESQRELVRKLKRARATGRIALEVEPDQEGVKSLPDVVLENGDRIFIPATPATVNVFGAVYSENAFLHRPSKRLADYVEQAGGPTRDADENSVYVLKANGSVTSRRQSGWFGAGFNGSTLMPGDTIVVPEDLNKVSWMKELKDWSQIIYQFALGGAALKTLRD